MQFNDKDNTIIFDMVSKFFQNSNNSCELEFRIGKFKEGFKSQNNPEVFYKIQNVYKKYYKWVEIKSYEINCIKETKNNEKISLEKIKKITVEDETEYIVKKPLRVYNIYDYDIKISIENEKKIDEEMFKELIVENNITNKCKIRTSFSLNDNMRLDLTVVKFDESTEFQIELEIIKTKNIDLKYLFEEICKHLTTIMQYKQKNYFIMTNKDKYKVYNEYCELVNNKYFVGAQPETLHFEHLNLLKKQYLLTYKADGERGLLFIDKISNVYILDTNFDNIIKTNIEYSYSRDNKSTLLDIEIINTEKHIIFLVFDVICHKGKDLRNTLTLTERLSLLKNIEFTNDFYKISLKPYIDNFQIGVDLMLNKIDLEYKKDGLIFVPLNEPYPLTKKWKTLLKWKPHEQNSIDFWIKQKEKRENGTLYELYINNPDNKQNNLELFKIKNNNNVSQLVNAEALKEWCNDDEDKEITWETFIYDNERDEHTGISYRESTVVEFYWSFEENRFIPIKTRWDKINNKQKWGNNINVAKDIWKSIKNPVKINNIKNINNSIKNQNLFMNMRKHHNYIKNYLYKYINKNFSKSRLIELCSGRGGDVNKWIYNDVSSVLGFDISKTNIDECYKRLEKYNDKQFSYKFIEQDLTDENLITELDNIITEKYEAVVCNFGIHYMFKNKKSIDNMFEIFDKYLKSNGLIILTFVDSEKILKLKQKWMIENNTLLYYIAYNDIKSESLWGNEISMYLNGDNILSTISHEYLVNIEMFKGLLKDDYSVVEHKNFSEITNDIKLDEYEKTISDLYSYIVIKKNKEVNDIPKMNTYKEVILPKTFGEINYYLQDKSFKLFKMTTETDFEFVNNLYDNNNKALNYIEIDYTIEKLKHLKLNISDIINKHDDNKLIFKINIPESDTSLYYLYTDNDYDISIEEKDEVIDNISKWIDIMIGSINVRDENNEQNQNQNQKDFNKMKLEELKNIARELKLPVSGKKSELIERIKVKIEKNF